MFTNIAFYIGNKHLGLYSEEYLLGELTTELLNLPRDQYVSMHKTLERAQESSKKYELHRKLEDWFQANEAYIRLDNLMSQYRLFRLLRASTEILYEAKELTSHRSRTYRYSNDIRLSFDWGRFPQRLSKSRLH